MNSPEKNFCKMWGNFFSTIFYPPVLFFILCTFGLLIANYFIKDNKIIASIISALMVLSGGLAGAYFRKRWEELTEKPHLVTKGKMAIRNLKLLVKDIAYYESRIKCYIDRIKNDDQNNNNTRFVQYLEEIIDWCKLLQEVCLTSIENWEDIIPEVKDLTSRIGTLFELRIEEDKLKNQVVILSKKLEESEEEKTNIVGEKQQLVGEKQQLTEQLSKKEEQIAKIEKQVQELKQSINSSVGGLTTNVATLGTSGHYGINYLADSDIGYNVLTTKRICRYCKKEYISGGLGLLSDLDNICQECRIVGPALGGGS